MLDGAIVFADELRVKDLTLDFTPTMDMYWAKLFTYLLPHVPSSENFAELQDISLIESFREAVS